MGIISYITVIFVLSVLSFSRSYWSLRVSVAICFVFSSSAMGFGYDWLNYKLVFDSFYVQSHDFVIIYEPAFSFILYIVAYFSLPFQWVVILSHIICFVFLYKYSSSFSRSSFVFLCCYSFFGLVLLGEQLRQAIALSIFLYSTTINGKRSYVFFLFALLFHYSVIFGALFIFVKGFLSGRKLFIKLVILCVLSYIMISSMVSLLISDVGHVFLPSFISGKVMQYVDSGAFGETGFSFGVLGNIFLAIYFMMLRVGAPCSVWRNGAVYFAIFSIQSRVVFFLYRISYYFLPFVFYSLHSYFDACLNGKRKVNVLVLIFVVFAYGLKPVSSPFFYSYLSDYTVYWFSDLTYAQREEQVCSNLLKIDPELDYCARRY